MALAFTAHLHSHDQLLEAVAGLVQLQASGVCFLLFFLRYGEGGPRVVRRPAYVGRTTTLVEAFRAGKGKREGSQSLSGHPTLETNP